MKYLDLDEVFGVSRNIPGSYKLRESVDDLFLESLQQKKHIVIFGSSKQGKTCLRKRHLRESRYITIHCNTNLDLKGINEQILKLAGYEITISKTNTVGGSANAEIEAGFKIIVQATAKFSTEARIEKNKTTSPFTIDLNDANDIINALKEISFTKIILLEDFHYLNIKTQIDFVNCLKAYYDESSLRFIMVGIWLDENKLITWNGDLAGRITSINADKWDSNDLKSMIEDGCYLLNIRFDELLIDDIIVESFDNVYFVQQMCYSICKKYKVTRTVSSESATEGQSGYFDYNNDFISTSDNQDNRFFIGTISNLSKISEEIVSVHSGRYISFLKQLFALKYDDINLSKWIIQCLLNSSTQTLQGGITFTEIYEFIKINHTNQLEISDTSIKAILNYLVAFQFEKNIKPIILDYDNGEDKLNIVDREFIIWLSFKNKNELLSSIQN